MIALLFFCSGAAALVIETTWLRWFRLLLGATAPAAAATLVAFFAGNAIGAAWAARAAPRWRNPLRSYGLLELGAAAGALAVPFALQLGEALAGQVYDSMREVPLGLAAFRIGLALLATLPASFCFGATLPAVGEAVVGRGPGLGRLGAGFYSINLLGAALGAALGSFVLPELLGISGGYGSALLLLAVVGSCAFVLSRSFGRAVAPTKTPKRTRRRGNQPRMPWLLAGLSGFGSFAAQVLLVHAFAQILNQSVYAFGAVLICVLVSLSVGAALVSAWVRQTGRSPHALLAVSLTLAALGFAAFPTLLYVASDGFAYLGSGGRFPAYLVTALATALLTAGPGLLAAALIFPLTFAVAEARTTAVLEAGPTLGRLVAANTVGALIGALAAPFVLLPWLGLWPAFALLGGLYALPALALWEGAGGVRLVCASTLALGALVLATLANPLALPATRLAEGEQLVAVESSSAGVVAVVARDDDLLIRTDGHYALGGTGETVRQSREGHLPLLLHPSARSVAFLGSATGISAGATTAHPIERLHIVEIVPAVAEAAKRHFAEPNRNVYDDPRVHVVLDDARNFMRHTQERFDVVVADLFVPWRSGTGALYAQEHFRAIHDRLEKDGIFCQWLPLYQLSREQFEIILASFLDAFPRAGLFRGDFYGRFPIVALVGYRDAPAAAKEIDAAIARLASSGEQDRWLIDPAGFWSLYIAPVSGLASRLTGVPRNSDDWPRIEFLAARGHVGGQVGIQRPFVGVAWSNFAASISGVAGSANDPLYPNLNEEARSAILGGIALQAAGAYWYEGDQENAGLALDMATRRLAPHLLEEASEDPTASEVWLP